MSILHIYIDESGDFGDAVCNADYYLVSMIFHDDKDPVPAADFIHRVSDVSTSFQYLHTAPLIRREYPFRYLTVDERRSLLYQMLRFVSICPFFCETIVIRRKEHAAHDSLTQRLSLLFGRTLDLNDEFFRSYDHLIIHYDNGQRELGKIIKDAFAIRYHSVLFEKTFPQKDPLLQAADFVCTMELLRTKASESCLSKSEKQFFYKPQELKKTFFKAIDKKKLSRSKHAH